MSTVPYPVWTGDPALEPAEPESAYVWIEEDQEWALVWPYLNKAGQEIGDPDPLEPPIGYKDTPDMWETVQRMVRTELLARELAKDDYGDFEEEDDFNVGDDFEPTSPYENEADVSISELMHAGREELARQEKETGRQAPQPKKPSVPPDENEAEPVASPPAPEQK